MSQAESFDFNRYTRGESARGGRGPVSGPPLGKLFDRSPPHSLEAEMSLLGSMILDPRVIADVMPIVRGPETFYDASHGKIYASIVALVDKTNAVDLVLLAQVLKDQGVLDAVGGLSYLEKLAFEVPTATNAPHFARIVTDKYRLRRLIDAAGQILYDTYHAGEVIGEEAKALIDSAEQRIFEIAQEEQTSDIEVLERLLHQEFERLHEIESGKRVIDGVRTGFYDLDSMLGGFQPGEMIILAARPSMGKTALLLNLAEQIAMGTDMPGGTRSVRDRVAVGVFSLEMSRSLLTQRMLSSWSGVSSHRIRAGQLRHTPEDEYALLLQATQQLGQAPIFIDDTPGLTITAMRARARRMVAQYKVGCIMVDYLQLVSSPVQARESRQVEVATVSRGIKALARELKVPILALSQLNRGPEGREGNRPRLSDLRESGSLEQDADVVLFLHREEYYHIQDPEWAANNPDRIGTAELIVAKQRNGPTGVVELTWNAETTRFANHADSAPPGPAHGHAAPAANPFTDRGGGRGTEGGGSGGGGGGGGWHPGRQSGPVADHRDGGGPDRDHDDERPLGAGPEEPLDPDEPAPF
jgi:replicative DNA helicase